MDYDRTVSPAPDDRLEGGPETGILGLNRSSFARQAKMAKGRLDPILIRL